MNELPVPPINPGTEKRGCPICSKPDRECVAMSLESKLAEETVPFELHYCWTCYRQLVKAIASVNRFYTSFAIAGAEAVNRRKGELAEEAAESDVLACAVDPQKRVEIIKGLRIQFGLGLGEAKGYVDAAYAKFGKPFGVPANGQPTVNT